jgi:hypothetical protein
VVSLETPEPPGYRLCPTISPANVVLDQRDFDLRAGAAPGGGRHAEVRWALWSR